MKIFKWTFLTLLLVFPIMIYLFLQGFGENQFEIPIFYEEGVELNARCDDQVEKTQYYVNLDSIYSLFPELSLEDKILVVDIENIISSKIQNNVNSFLEKYKEIPNVIFLSLGTTIPERFNETKYKNWGSIVLLQSDLIRLRNCSLRIGDQQIQGNQLVMIDTKKRIRGYYDPKDLPEIDRLNTEIFILLKQ